MTLRINGLTRKESKRFSNPDDAWDYVYARSIICSCKEGAIRVGKVFRFMWEKNIIKFKCPKCKQWIKQNRDKWRK